MNSDTKKNPEESKNMQPQQQKKPDDLGNIQIDCYVKIFDPNTKEVLVETRA